MKFIGWIGIIHAVFIVFWMRFNIIFSIMNPIAIEEGETLAQIGMDYHTSFIGYLAMDHGSKSFMMLLTIAVPIATFYLLKRKVKFELYNIIGLFSGSLGFLLYSLSLMLQASSVAYAFNLYKSDVNEFTDAFALLLYEWTMLEGGFSTSIYILANILIAIWVIILSRGLQLYTSEHKVSVFGLITGILHIIAYLISWVLLMFGMQVIHTLTEAIGLLFVVWIFLVGVVIVKGKLKLSETHSQS
ncbi:hypothetical protein HUG20_03525 [Salicibibacter cibi]|uniref:DUF4386 domain-containing protein n=1 Tax=Salicibibacter cibi TaxID=2743001 RepID=A0A7T6Z997_9BACI|nr:hypothetical protein [Salicibibacter cibi]QQK79062.1 hypothetical protein HUG20_03525 [Salicibibacter cibi]